MWRRVAGIAVVAAIGVGGAVAYYAMENQSDSAAEAAPSTTTTTAAATTTTPITPSAEFLAAADYEQDLAEIGARVQVLVDGVLEVNERWDQRDVSQEFAAEFLNELEQFAQQIEFRLRDVSSRPAVALRHDLVERSVAVLADDVALVRQGLLEPGSREQRDDATLVLIVDADLTLEAIDLALEANSLSMERPPGRQVLRDTLRVGDCTTSRLDAAIVVLASCTETESGIVLATVDTTAQADMSSFACQRAAQAHVDTDTWELEGTWTIQEVGGAASGSRVLCFYDAGTDPKPAIASSGPMTGPVTATSGAPLVQLDLVEPTSIEAGDCFTDSPDSESHWIADAYSTTCDAEDARYAVVAVRFVAVDASATKANRSALQVWRVCENAAAELDSGEPFVSEVFLVPVHLDPDDSESPFFTVACVGSIEAMAAALAQDA